MKKTVSQNRAIFVIISAFFAGTVLSASPAAAEEQPRIDYFKTTRPTVSGEPMTFTWQAQHAKSCTAFGGWSGTKGLVGNEKVAAPGATTLYTLQCIKGGHTASASIEVLVNPSAVTFDFVRTPKYVLATVGSTLQVAWYGLPTSFVCSINANGMRLYANGTGSETFTLNEEGVYRYSLDCNGRGLSASPSVIEATATSANKSRFITAGKVANGDKAGSFQVADIRQLNPKNPKDPYHERATPTNVRLDLRGRATVTGTYRYLPDAAGNIFERNRVCMDALDGASEQQLPQLLHSKKSSTRFCFNNGSQAAELLSAKPGYSGTATVVISGYTLIGDTEERPDETYLLSVSAKKQLSPMTVTVEKPNTPTQNTHGQQIIIYLQPNQKIQIVDASTPTPTVKASPAKRAIPRRAVRKVMPKKITAKPRVTAKPKAKTTKKSSPTQQPPVGASTIKKVVPKQSAATEVKPKTKIAQPVTKLYDAYIN